MDWKEDYYEMHRIYLNCHMIIFLYISELVRSNGYYKYIKTIFARRNISGLPSEIKILVAINFLANNSYQTPVGNQYNFVVSQPSMNRCIRRVIYLINIHLLRRWITFPMTVEERIVTRNKFARAPQPFPGVIGAINCTYINILAPHIHEEAYVNHHGNHSLSVQAVSITTL